MMFLLTGLKISYILDDGITPIPDTVDNEEQEIKDQRKKRDEDEVLCRGHILNRLSDRLYNLNQITKGARYNNEKQGTNKFLIMKYFEFSMNTKKPVMDQVHDLQSIVNRLKELKIDIHERLKVGEIIAKLPTTWNNYRKKLLHTTEELSLDQI
ncbi:LOW QUALITY PROTEIN: hypothetical protein V2J09_006489 [Rumex salicifolius]